MSYEYLAAGERRGRVIRLRVSEDEHVKILAAVAERGQDSISDDIRLYYDLPPSRKSGAPKGNQNKTGKKGGNATTVAATKKRKR